MTPQLLGWLHATPLPQRRGVLTLTPVVLATGTLAIPHLPVSELIQHAIAVWMVALLVLAWVLLYWRYARPAIVRARSMSEAAEATRGHDRSLLVGGALRDHRGGLDHLSLVDPGFSLPAFIDFCRRLHEAAILKRPIAEGWCQAPAPHTGANATSGRLRPLSITRSKQAVHCRMRVEANIEGVMVHHVMQLSRPAEASSPTPDALTDLERLPTPSDWTLVDIQTTHADAPPLPPSSPQLTSAKRALIGRDPSFTPQRVESRARLVLTAVQSDTLEDTHGLTTPSGASDASLLLADHAHPEAPVTWLEIAQDGWFERVEITIGGVLIGLLRPIGADSPWLVWRITEGGQP